MVRQFLKSAIGMSWALSLLGLKRLGDALSMDKDSDPLSSGQSPLPVTVDDNQASLHKSREARQMRPIRGSLSLDRFIVVGEGLAAGMGDLTLYDGPQNQSFPAQMARQMQIEFHQPLLQSPGIGGLAGFPDLPVVLPDLSQTTLYRKFPPSSVNNLSVPGFTVRDSVQLHIAAPVVHRRNAKQTALNILCGILPLAYGDQTLPTQLQCALERSPTLAVVELGYYEVIEAAVGQHSALPQLDQFHSDYSELLSKLRITKSEIVVLTIPNPFDTAHFSSIDVAAKILRVPASFLLTTYRLQPDALLTLEALNEIGFQLFSRNTGNLPHNSVIPGSLALQTSARVNDLNAIVNQLAQNHGAAVLDLHGIFSKVAADGVQVGSRLLTREYLGGFYGLNGYYPGTTGQALIANEMLSLLNRTYGADFPLINLDQVITTDSSSNHEQAAGSLWTAEALHSFLSQKLSRVITPVEDAPQVGHSGGGSQPELPLRLPPDLHQELPLSRVASYFGDGIAAKKCECKQDLKYGACGNLLFRGLAMVDSHLSGTIHITFSPPENDVTHFEISFPEGLWGEDAVLAAPTLFKMPFQQNSVRQVPGRISSGVLNLQTGEVSNLVFYASYDSTALRALVSVNPKFPTQPLSFPGAYGSANAKFAQRPDGNLDFTFYGSTFVPLGDGTRWPLNFFSPEMKFATIPADGTVMHPHLCLSTRAPECSQAASSCLSLPYNSIQELTLLTHNSSFGDAFHLESAELGGPAKGRSHVLGRVVMQIGEPAGGSVPVAVFTAAPGGIFAPLPNSPLTDLFPGRLSPGPQGFNENLRFPQRNYPLDDLSIIDDPFDISVGAVDLKTGLFLNEHLHRAFISQDLLFALLRVEPRTPKDSFFFHGPAWLETGHQGELLFHFRGGVTLPYPSGYQFPRPDMTTSLGVGPNSRLDPFLWLRAATDPTIQKVVQAGEGSKLRASTGDEFSYHFTIPSEGNDGLASFEYENHTQNGKFKMHRLAWVDSIDSNCPAGQPDRDTITFTGFGIWCKDGVESVQQAAVQISSNPASPYVGIQIGGGDVSNVNTKPENEQEVLP